MAPLHPFDDTRLLIEGARKHIDEFDARLKSFISGGPCTVLAEPDSNSGNYVHKLRFGDGIDRGIKIPAAEAIHKLRVALDHLTAACARLNGASRFDSSGRVNRYHFPFLRNPREWKKTVKERCALVPHPVIEFFWSLQPYPGGRDKLYVLNSVRNENEHWALSDITLAVSAIAIGGRGLEYQIINFPEWPASGINEIDLFTSPEKQTDYSCALPIEMRFEGVPQLVESPDFVLRNFADKVRKIIDNTEMIMRANYFPV